MKAFCFMLTLLTLASAAPAQEIQEQLRLAQRRNWFVRLVTDTAVIAQGRVQLGSGVSFLVGQQPVELTEVQVIERRTNVGGGWQTGTLVGGAVGATLGLGLSQLCGYECNGEAVKIAVVMAIPTAAIGGVLGYFINPPSHEWTRIWP